MRRPPNAAFVAADQDFGGALEITKTDAVQRVRWMGETPILPGCYLRITARVKALSGALPTVRVAGWAGGAGGVAVTGLTAVGPAVTLTAYGRVVEVSAIVGTGRRTGVDMVWGGGAVYGHFGIDITGPNGGVVRVDDIVIEDVTGAFLRTMMDWVDVRDYGALGDGVADDRAAFAAADAAAAGRQVYVPAGTYRIGSNLTIENEVRFEGRVTMAAATRLILRRNFDLNGYIDAFGSELEAFRRGFQALLHFSDHESFDLCGRRIEIEAPIDMRAAAAPRPLRGAAGGAERADQLHGRRGLDDGAGDERGGLRGGEPAHADRRGERGERGGGLAGHRHGRGAGGLRDREERGRGDDHAVPAALGRAREPDLHLPAVPLRARLLGVRAAVADRARRPRHPVQRARERRSSCRPRGRSTRSATAGSRGRATGGSPRTGRGARTCRWTAAR